MELTINFEFEGKIFVCGECGKRYDNYEDWVKCCDRWEDVRKVKEK